MSSNSYNFWQFTPNHPGYYYVSRNIADPQWYDYIEDPYFWDLYATGTNYYMEYYYYYYQPTGGYIDDPFTTNSQSFHTYNGQSSFDYIDDSYLWYDDFNQLRGEFIDGVYATNEWGLFDHHEAQANHYFSPHNLDHPIYNGQSSLDHIDNPNLWADVYNQPIGGFIVGVYVTADGIAYLTDISQILVYYMETNEEEEEEEEIIGNMMKTRIHCATDDRGEICSICQCEYENDETICTLECQHEYHASCINEWLLLGKRSCPICRSSVLPS